MLNFSKSVLKKNQTHLHLVWPEDEYTFSEHFHFWVNDSFKGTTVVLSFSYFLQHGCFSVVFALISFFCVRDYGWIKLERWRTAQRAYVLCC